MRQTLGMAARASLRVSGLSAAQAIAGAKMAGSFLGASPRSLTSTIRATVRFPSAARHSRIVFALSFGELPLGRVVGAPVRAQDEPPIEPLPQVGLEDEAARVVLDLVVPRPLRLNGLPRGKVLSVVRHDVLSL